MKCPRCQLGVHIQADRSVYEIRDESDRAINGKYGAEVSHGLCPECGKLLVMLREGPLVVHEEGPELQAVIVEQPLFPAGDYRQVDESVPERYRRDFQEAALLVNLSPRASAALSRRLLQTLIRDEYRIKKGDLYHEIEELRSTGTISQMVRDSVDVIRQVGNIAAHPEWTTVGELVDVEPDEAAWLLDVLELIFEDRFVAPRRGAVRKQRLNEKLLKLGKPTVT